MAIKSYRDLEVYRRAKALVVPMHRLVAEFPAHERFDLCDHNETCQQVSGGQHRRRLQPQRYARQGQTVLAQRDGSANEMVEHLETAVALGYASQDACRPYIEEYTITAKQLNKLIQNWQKL